MKRYDLIVVGGGFTGVAAAISAARNGLKTLLIEHGNCLGGAAVNNLVNPFMPYWTNGDDNRDYLSKGFFTEILDGLKAGNALAQGGMTFDEEYLKLMLNRMALQNHVELLFNTTVVETAVKDEKIHTVTVYNKSGKFEMAADYFIDATGDADLTAMSGVPCDCGRDEDGLCQPMTLCFRVANIDPDRFNDKARETMQKVYTRNQKEGNIQNPREDVLIFRTLCPSIWHFNTTRVVRRDPTNGFDITAAEIESREQVFELMALLRREVPGFENAVLVSTALQIGVRESRRLCGKHVLTADELKACTRFEDTIAVGNYDIDIHNPAGSGTTHYFFKAGDYYTIPYGSLVPRDTVTNLLVAGRCISATHEAQASIRIMPICCCLGEAAGVAAACAFHQDGCAVGDVNVAAVQKKLVENGARIN